MRSFILILSLLFVPLAAETVDVEKLPPAIQAQIKTASVREEVEAWGTLGANVGKAIVGAAKEVGVAATEFAETPLGILVCALIVWKLLGAAVIGLLIAVVTPVLGFYVARKVERYSHTYGDPVVTKHLWGLFSTTHCPVIRTSDDGYVAAAIVIRIISGVIAVMALTVVATNV